MDHVWDKPKLLLHSRGVVLIARDAGAEQRRNTEAVKEPRFSHVIFDFDGTIFQTTGALQFIYSRLAPKYRLPKIDAATYETLRELPVSQRLAKLKISPVLLPFLVRDARRLYRSLAGAYPPEPGMPEVLEDLARRGVTVAIISSNGTRYIRASLAKFGLTMFDDVICSGLFKKARAIRAYVKRRNASPDAVLYVGDEHRDVEASHAAGVHVAAVTWGYDTRKNLEAANPTFIVDTPEELGEILAQAAVSARG